MKHFVFAAPFLLAGAALLGGCVSAYVPTAPPTPLIDKGQVEVAAGLRSLHYAEASVAWSPLPHVLLLGEAAIDMANTQPQDTSRANYHDRHSQGNLGVGLYGHPGANKSYLAVLAGMGWGHNSFFAEDDYKPASIFLPLPLPTHLGVYDTRYRRYYGQVYFAEAEPARGPRVGGSLRVVGLDFTYYTYSGGSVAIAKNRLLFEPTVFVRFGRGALRYFTTAGFSLPAHADAANPYDKRVVSQSYLFSGGVIFRPDLLKKRRQ